MIIGLKSFVIVVVNIKDNIMFLNFFDALQCEIVVSIGHFAAFYVVLVPLEYIPTLPPHFTYVIVFVKENP